MVKKLKIMLAKNKDPFKRSYIIINIMSKRLVKLRKNTYIEIISIWQIKPFYREKVDNDVE